MAAIMFRGRSLRGTRSLRRRHDSEEEMVHMDFNRAISDNLREILMYIVRREGVSKSRKLGYLNCLVKLSGKMTPQSDLGFTLEEMFCCLRVSLLHEACEVRAAGLRAMRYLVLNRDSVKALCSVHIPLMVTRCLDIVLDNRIERVQALRLVRKIVTVAADCVPSELVRCVVAVASDGAHERDSLVKACLGTLCELALLNPNLCSEVGGLRVLIRSVLDCLQPHIAEAILGVILFIINSPDTRHLIRLDTDLEHLVAPFTDCHFRYSADLPDHSVSDDKETRFAASRIAVTSILRSWPGMIYFCKQGTSGLQSLVNILYLPFADSRKNIMEVLYDVFCVPVPDWTSDFTSAILSYDKSSMQESWQLYESFVASEGKDLLPSVTKHRSNLVGNYLALLLLAFIQAGIFEALIEVIISSDNNISIQATILLAELLHMASILLPSENSHHCHCLPSLMKKAACFSTSPQQRDRASTAVSMLSCIHSLKKRGVVPCSLFLDQLLQFCSPLRKKTGFFDEFVSITKLWQCLKKDSDEVILHSIKDTQVLSKDFTSWDWDLIGSILKWPGESLKKLEESNHRSFIKRLLQFYKPTSKQFSLIEAEREKSRHICVVGCHFFDFLLEAEESKATEYLEEFLVDLNSCLQTIEVETVSLSAILSPTRVMSNLCHAYFLFIGRFSSSSKGRKFLEKLGVFQHLLNIVNLTSHEAYMKLVVSSLDYTKPGFARTLLTKVLTATSENSRLYATNYLRVLLRVQLTDFRKWAIELLVTQLYDKSRAVSLAAADILDEACDIQENLEALIALRPSLLHLGDRGLLLLIHFLSLPSGFKFLKEANFLETEFEKWNKVNNLKYVKIVDDLINQAVTRHQRGEDGTYGRRSSSTRHRIQNVFAPAHMYGQLAQHEEGLNFLIEKDSLCAHFETIRIADMSNQSAVLSLRASLWAVGHVGTSVGGFRVVSEADVISNIIFLAEEAPVYSVRGTSFYVLCLLAVVPEAAEIFTQYGWESVKHAHGESWPVVKESVCFDLDPQSVFRPHSWSVSSTGSYWSDMPSDNAIHRRFRYSPSVIMYPIEDVEQPKSGNTLNLIQEGKVSVYDKRTFSFVSQQSEACKNVRYAQTLPRNVTFSARQDPVVVNTRPRSSSDCRPNDHNDITVEVRGHKEDSMDSVNLRDSADVLSIPEITKDRSSSFGGSRNTEVETEAFLKEKSMSNIEVSRRRLEVHQASQGTLGPKDERSDSNESSQTGTSKSRSDSCTDSTTSGVSSCDSVTTKALHLEHSQTLSPIASSTSLNTLGSRRDSTNQYDGPLRPHMFPHQFPPVPKKNLIPSPTSPDGLYYGYFYTSARDALGYATLRAIQRRRVRSFLSEEDPGFASAEDHKMFSSGNLDQGLESSFYIGDDEDITGFRSGTSRHYSFSSDVSRSTSKSSSTPDPPIDPRYMGLCLPADASRIFRVHEACQQQTSSSETPLDVIDEEKQTSSSSPTSSLWELHTYETCILCHRVAKLKCKTEIPTESDEARFDKPLNTGTPKSSGIKLPVITSESSSTFLIEGVSIPSLTRGNSRRLSDEPIDRYATRKEILRHITHLSSSIAMKGSEQGLLSLKQKLPLAFQDICLYSEICLQMSKYRFRLSARHFIQELFQDLNFEKLYEEAEAVLEIIPVITVPPAEESEV